MGTRAAAPDHLLFQMDKATTVGGRVVRPGPDSRSPAQPSSSTSRSGYPRSRQRVDLEFRLTETDANGRWSFSCVPEKPDSIKVTAYHHLCHHRRTVLPSRRSSSRSRRSAMDRRPFTSVAARSSKGTVIAPDGRPVADAEILVGTERRYGNSIPPVKTDTQGRFRLGFTPGIATALTARHAGFGPVEQPIRSEASRSSSRCGCQPAHTMSGRVVGRDGKPLLRAHVGVKSWRGSQALEQDLKYRRGWPIHLDRRSRRGSPDLGLRRGPSQRAGPGVAARSTAGDHSHHADHDQGHGARRPHGATDPALLARARLRVG